MCFVHNHTEHILDIRRNILVFGNSAMLGELAAVLRVSPLLLVIEKKELDASETIHPDVILVDAAQVRPEQFSELIAVCPFILSIDPLTYQVIVLSTPHHANPLAETARVVGILSFTLPQPA